MPLPHDSWFWDTPSATALSISSGAVAGVIGWMLSQQTMMKRKGLIFCYRSSQEFRQNFRPKILLIWLILSKNLPLMSFMFLPSKICHPPLNPVNLVNPV
jgi:hypothetical protein